MPIEAIKDYRLRPNEFKVLISLYSYADPDGKCFPKRANIAELTGINQSRVSRITTRLERLGWLRKEGSGGRSRACKYHLKTVSDFDTVLTETVTETVTRIEQTNILRTDQLRYITRIISLAFHLKQQMDGIFHSDFKTSLTAESKIVVEGAEAVEKLHRIDAESIEDICKVLDFILTDTTQTGTWKGWKSNIISLKPIRQKSKNGNSKYFNAKNSMNQSGRKRKTNLDENIQAVAAI